MNTNLAEDLENNKIMNKGNQELIIMQADSLDHTALTDLTKASKAYWGFSDDLMKKWEKELTITEAYIIKNEVFKAHTNGALIGYYSFFSEKHQEIVLDNLFISPACIGKGFGKQLMNDFLARAKELNPKKIILYSEPKAQLFYEKFGFKVIGQHASPIPNRFLPIMEKNYLPLN